MDILSNLNGFDWDEGNITKNWEKHGVAHVECEEVFFNEPLVVKKDDPHSKTETRYYVLGRTNSNRLLFLVFAIRGKRVLLSNLKPSTKTISIRLSEPLLERLKALANKKDVPYQSLIKMFLSERVEKELVHKE